MVRTRRQGLLELVCLLRVVEDQRIQVAGAPDLELGLVLLPSDARHNLLYPRI